jgi:hypothetical protein
MLPLSPLMIKTLRIAYDRQKNNLPLGQVDLEGSFMALLKREFIDCSTTIINEKKIILWFVTSAGISALKNLGAGVNV